MTRKPRGVLIVASLAFVSSQTYLAYLLGGLRPNILTLQLTFHAGRYWEILGLWGELGQRAYQGHFGYDGVHAVIYAVFGYLLATRSGLYPAAEAQAIRPRLNRPAPEREAVSAVKATALNRMFAVASSPGLPTKTVMACAASWLFASSRP